jgi:hypothetical protein
METGATTISKDTISRYLPTELKIRGYLLSIILLSVPIYSYCLLHSILVENWEWLYLALLTALVSCFPLRIFSLQDRLWLTLSDVFVFVALFHFGAEVAVVIASIEAAAFNLRRRPKEAYRWVFNLSQIILVAFLVGQLFNLMVSWLIYSEQMGIGAVVLFLTAPWACGFLYYSLSSGLTGLAVALNNSHSFLQTWVKNLSWYYVSVLGAVLAALTHLLVQYWL